MRCENLLLRWSSYLFSGWCFSMPWHSLPNGPMPTSFGSSLCPSRSASTRVWAWTAVRWRFPERAWGYGEQRSVGQCCSGLTVVARHWPRGWCPRVRRHRSGDWRWREERSGVAWAVLLNWWDLRVRRGGDWRKRRSMDMEVLSIARTRMKDLNDARSPWDHSVDSLTWSQIRGE